MSDRSPFEAQRDRARAAIAHANQVRQTFDAKGRFAGYGGTDTIDFGSVAIAEAILTLAEAVRPAPVEVSVKVDIDEDQIVQSVRDAVEGGAA
ncbi:hypothetical protein [Cellulosimicrobium funkei]|uniref:hypothetical protein n=1 Tax=Cellulosimicrobium funkei TaxID=264251 RepID=UPI00343F7CEF